MSKKAIVLVRTSTIKQEVESQRKEVIQFAINDGHYSEENIIEVGGKGVSAIKLDEQYDENLQTIYNLIENDKDIDCVYAWAIDRIGRKEKVLMEFKERLISHQVNIKIKNPNLVLLAEDGSVNEAMELSFSLFSTMAMQEMKSKKARFKRAKDRNRKEGKWNGGRMMFGYTVDEDGKYKEHLENAKVVRDIFSEYAYSPVSTRALAKKYTDLGYVKARTLRTRECYIQRMLKNKAYIGESVLGYPRIISDQIFNDVQEKLKNFRVLPKVKYAETPYYCQGLLYDYSISLNEGALTDKHPMRVKKSECSYVSYTEHFSLNINTFDSAMVFVVNRVLEKADTSAIEKQIEETRNRYLGDIENIKAQIASKRSKNDELDDRYFGEGGISPQVYDRNKKKIELDIKNLERQLEVANKSLSEVKDFKLEKVDLYGLDDFERRAIIMKYVHCIFARKMDKYQAEIDVSFTYEIGMGYNFTYNRKDKTMTTYFYHPDGTPDLEVIPIPIIRNIKGRKRDYKGKRNGKQLNVQG